MVVDLAGPLLELIAQYGLIAIFILLVLDGAALLPAFPGEIVMIIMVSQYVETREDLVFVILLATLAAMLGSLFLYGVARGGGRRLVESHPRLFMMNRRRQERLERLFQRPVGQSLVFFLRLFPLTRVLVNLPAGLARMPMARFVVLSTMGMVLYHAAFLWFAFEVRQPDSHVGARADAFSEAYASPAWDFAQANSAITIAALLVLGVLLSIRASIKSIRDPEEGGGSLIGFLATMVLFWGGVALWIILYVEPSLIFQAAEVGGLTIEDHSFGLPYEPLSMVAVVGTAAFLLGLLLMRLRAAARRRRKRHEQTVEDEDDIPDDLFGPMTGEDEPVADGGGPDDDRYAIRTDEGP